MQITPSTAVAPAKGVVFRRLGEGRGGVLLKLDTGAYHSLNETGAILWQTIQDGERLESSIEELRTQLEDSPGNIVEDVIAFFQELADRELVTVSPQGTTTPPEL